MKHRGLGILIAIGCFSLFGCDEAESRTGGPAGAAECVGSKCDNAGQDTDGDGEDEGDGAGSDLQDVDFTSALARLRECEAITELTILENADPFRYSHTDVDASRLLSDIDAAKALIDEQGECLVGVLDREQYFALFEEESPSLDDWFHGLDTFGPQVCAVAAASHSDEIREVVRSECINRILAQRYRALLLFAGLKFKGDLESQAYLWCGEDEGDSDKDAWEVAHDHLLCTRSTNDDIMKQVEVNLKVAGVSGSDLSACVDFDFGRSQAATWCEAVVSVTLEERTNHDVLVTRCQAEIESVVGGVFTSLGDFEDPSDWVSLPSVSACF